MERVPELTTNHHDGAGDSPPLPFVPLQATLLRLSNKGLGASPQLTRALDAAAVGDPASTVALAALNTQLGRPAVTDFEETQPLRAGGSLVGGPISMGQLVGAASTRASVVPRRVQLTLTLPASRGESQAFILKDADGAEVLTLVLGAMPVRLEGEHMMGRPIRSIEALEFGAVTVKAASNDADLGAL